MSLVVPFVVVPEADAVRRSLMMSLAEMSVVSVGSLLCS